MEKVLTVGDTPAKTTTKIGTYASSLRIDIPPPCWLCASVLNCSPTRIKDTDNKWGNGIHPPEKPLKEFCEKFDPKIE